MAHHPTVYLMGLPDYKQGSHDGLCVYYSACMMLASLYPEMHVEFGRGDRKRRASVVTYDPLFEQASKGDDTSKSLADWFYRGKHLCSVVEHLNAVVAERYGTPRLFIHGGAEKYCRDETRFKSIKESIDEGLPVMLAWTTRDLGEHCVLVRGYTVGQKRWLHVRDPGGGDDICWDTLVELSSDGVEYILPQSVLFAGARPDKLCYRIDGENEIRERGVWRYWPSRRMNGGCEYRLLQDVFEEAVAMVPRGVA